MEIQRVEYVPAEGDRFLVSQHPIDERIAVFNIKYGDEDEEERLENIVGAFDLFSYASFVTFVGTTAFYLFGEETMPIIFAVSVTLLFVFSLLARGHWRRKLNTHRKDRPFVRLEMYAPLFGRQEWSKGELLMMQDAMSQQTTAEDLLKLIDIAKGMDKIHRDPDVVENLSKSLDGIFDMVDHSKAVAGNTMSELVALRESIEMKAGILKEIPRI